VSLTDDLQGYIDMDAMPPDDLIAAAMNALPEVKWDRCTRSPERCVAFGWISRGEDPRSDFVVLTFAPDTVAMTTSSARYSREFARRLFGEASALTHRDCERVADVFGDLVLHKVQR
jgi:hypothetical protein